MAMPRKRTRLITVDTIQYRWTLSSHNALCVADRDIIVELANEPVGKLLAKPTAIDQWFGDDYNYTVTPALIEQGIREALNAGWAPNNPGDFRLPCPYNRIR